MGSLRTILAITVVFAHSPWNDGFVFVGPRNAVQLFYVISGFLISHVILVNPAYKDPLRFYANRALRIYPIYYAVALLTLLAIAVAHGKFFDLYRNIPPAAVGLLVFSNLFLLGQDWVMFSGVSNGHLVFTPDFKRSEFELHNGLLVPQAWTLGLELTFYAVAPFILHRTIVVLALVVLSLLTRCILIGIGLGMDDPWTYRFFPAELSLFLLGALSNRYLLPAWKHLIPSNALGLISRAGTYLMLGLTIFYFLIPGNEIFKSLFLISVFLILLPLTFIHQNASRIDKAIGDLSYPTYIGHVLVVMTLGKVTGYLGIRSEFLVACGNVLAALLFAYFLNVFLGERIERMRKKLGSGRSSPKPTLGATAT